MEGAGPQRAIVLSAPRDGPLAVSARVLPPAGVAAPAGVLLSPGWPGAAARASSPRWRTGSAKISSNVIPSARSSCMRRQTRRAAERVRSGCRGRASVDEVELGGQHAPAGSGSRRGTGRAGPCRAATPSEASSAPQLDAQPVAALLEQPRTTSSGEQARHQRQPGLERGELAHRRGQQLGQPVLELLEPGRR